MPNWKNAERRAASLIGGRRYPANTGGLVDVESSWAVAQVKEVRRLSLRALTDLARAAERDGRAANKTGMVFVREHAGRGRGASPMLVVMTAAVWEDLHGPMIWTDPNVPACPAPGEGVEP